MREICSITTRGTSIRIPARAFADREFFAFSLAAWHVPELRDGQLIPVGVPQTTIRVTSGAFRINATCGNGVIDPGELCDAGHETADCDLDCTLPAQGDGHRNAAAGEVCDMGGDSEACGADGLPPRCGDGVSNTTVEDCDDGNARDDGNGCTADCRFNGVCGNGVRELGELCDAGAWTARCATSTARSRSAAMAIATPPRARSATPSIASSAPTIVSA